jgi:hypothetical protein
MTHFRFDSYLLVYKQVDIQLYSLARTWFLSTWLLVLKLTKTIPLLQVALFVKLTELNLTFGNN